MIYNLDNIIVDDLLSLSGSKSYRVKIFLQPSLLFPPPDMAYLKKSIEEPLVQWCNNCFNNHYDINFRFNNGDPYWSLLIESEEDLLIFMLRFNHINKH